MEMTQVGSGILIEESDLEKLKLMSLTEDMDALSIAKRMLSADPSNEVLKKTVEILSAEMDDAQSHGSGESSLEGAKALLAEFPQHQVLQSAVRLVEESRTLP